MLLAAAEQRDRRAGLRAIQRPDSQFGGMRGIFAVTDTVHDRQQRSLGQRLCNVTVPGLFLPRKGFFSNAPLDQGHRTAIHFLTVTTVPCPS